MPSLRRYMRRQNRRRDRTPQERGHDPMTDITARMIRARPVAAAAIAIAVVGAATILGAWFFQYGLGLKPCPLCLEQRYAYYFAIPLAVLVLLGDQSAPRARCCSRRSSPSRSACCGTPARRLSFRHRMEVVAGPAGMRGRARRSRPRRRAPQASCSRSAWCAATRRPGASSAVARRLQRADLARCWPPSRRRRAGRSGVHARGKASNDGCIGLCAARLAVPIEIVEPAVVQIVGREQPAVAVQVVHARLERHLRRPHLGLRRRLEPLVRLQGEQAATTLTQVVWPPRERGSR